ncbi:MAG: CPBP family intramembrane metalloprotease, partial [Clostridia bacterium]|nr:CPBP family intramembrane metalloprotease [Clostridia bacterium]
TNIKAVLISLIIGVFVYILTIFISSFFSAVITFFGYEPLSAATEPTQFPVWLLIVELITTAVLPGICEEVANRGMLLNCYKKMGAKKAILLSGLFFGLMHLNINQFFYATIIGFYLGFVALLCDNIWPVIIIHFTNNALSTFMSFASVNDLWVYRWVDKMFDMVLSSGAVSGIFALFIFVSFVSIVLYWLTKKLCKETRVRHLTQVADQMLRTQLRNELMKDVEEAEVQQIQNDTGLQLTQQTVGGRTVFNIDFSKEIMVYKPYVPTAKENIFMYANLFLGIVVTLFTFIWGIL